MHTLLRNKVALFGTSADLQGLDASDTSQNDAAKLTLDLFGSFPVAELRWADSPIWHLPYLVVATSTGAIRVESEAERRAAFTNAGDEPGSEPGWAVLKNQLTLSHNLANTGRGLVYAAANSDGSPYSSGNSIFMGWSLSVEDTDGNWSWDKVNTHNTPLAICCHCHTQRQLGSFAI